MYEKEDKELIRILLFRGDFYVFYFFYVCGFIKLLLYIYFLIFCLEL